MEGQGWERAPGGRVRVSARWHSRSAHHSIELEENTRMEPEIAVALEGGREQCS